MRRIDVYIDMTNTNNCWGMIYTKDPQKPLSREEKEFVRFINQDEMIGYIRNQFKSKDVVSHFVDYSCIEYQFYTNRPQYNRIVIKYYEYVKGKRKAGKVEMPEEFENIFVDILKLNKKLPANYVLDSRYHRIIDVDQQRKENEKELFKSIKMSLEEFFSLAGNKINNIRKNKKAVGKIALFVTVAMLGSIIGKGYSLVKKNEQNSLYLNQDNPIKNIQDLNVYINKGNAGLIIEKLLKNQYDNIDYNDINKTTKFIRLIENQNYDNNGSFNAFNFSDYFGYKTPMDTKNYNTSDNILKKIEKLYQQCFVEKNGKVIFKKENANKYIDYVASLTFMYDVYHDTRPSLISGNNQSITSSFATADEISVYDSYPPILRYIILNQLRSVLQRSNYEVKKSSAYYFKAKDKSSLIEEVDNKMSSCKDELLVLCQNKTI